MQIREARIFNFGKLQNVNFRFKEGINVVYGENEHGKTTLHAFLVGMLFGMEKGRGRVGVADAYGRYEPWHAPAFYSGALRFLVGGQPFYLERNFYSKEKSDYLRNEADGEELSVGYGDLKMLLGGIGREEFGNTYDIPQSGAVTGKEMAELLTAYLAEAAAGGDGNVHVISAGRLLQAKKKEVLQKQRSLELQRLQKVQERRVAREVHKNNVTEITIQIRNFEAEQRKLEAERIFKEEQKRQRRKLCAVIALLAGVLAAAIIFAGAVKLWKAFVIEGAVGAGAVFLLALFGMFAFRKGGEDEALTHASMMLAQMKERQKEMENELINLDEEIRELEQMSIEEQELAENAAALELAKQELSTLSEEYYLEVCDELNAEISKWISLLTNGIYDSARLDKNGKLWIVAENREVAPESLSRGTLEQIYLALRLAAGNTLLKEEEMPVFLDEAFAMYDDVRLAKTLQALSKTSKQIILFTCQKREISILQQEGIPYHEITM